MIAIHQPNYLPWLGYFAKMLQVDKFIFLDNVGFSKGSVTNRVRIRMNGAVRWLTVPISTKLGLTIDETFVARADWSDAHHTIVGDAYRKAPYRLEMLATLEPAWRAASRETTLASINGVLVNHLAAALEIKTPLIWASDLTSEPEIDRASGDERLIALTRSQDVNGTYLSGRGAEAYQDANKFAAAGLSIKMTRFVHPKYPQTGVSCFTPGLSVIDAVAELGWVGTAQMLRESVCAREGS